MNNNFKLIGEYIQEVLKENNLSQEDLAKYLCMSKGKMTKIMANECMIDKKILEKIKSKLKNFDLNTANECLENTQIKLEFPNFYMKVKKLASQFEALESLLLKIK